MQNSYKAKYWLSKNMYLAEIKGKLALVTVNDKGEIIRVSIFGEDQDNK